MVMDLKEKIEQVKLNRENVNCLGTAAYLVGIIEEDRFLSGGYFGLDYLRNLKKVDNPQYGDLIVFRSCFDGVSKIAHAGVLVNVNPLKMTHRSGINEGIVENENLEDSLYNNFSTLEFYRK
jgi:hypothetical protein